MVLHGEGQEGGFFVLGIADADVPCALVVGVEAADFAHIDKGLADAVLLQQGGDFVGDVALGDAVEGQAHAFLFEEDGFLVEDDVFEADEFEGAPDVWFGRRGFGTRVAAEMVCVKIPQYLDGGVERAVGQGMDVAADAQKGEEVGRRVVQTTFFVQPVD